MLALPILWVNGMAMLVAILPLVPGSWARRPAQAGSRRRRRERDRRPGAAPSAAVRARSSARPCLGLWLFLAIALPALASLIATLPTTDLAYQLRAGTDILGGGGVPAHDAWTFTAAGLPWLDQQWGAQVILAAVYGAAGWTGLAILRAAMVALVSGLILRRSACGLPGSALGRRPG